MSVAVNMRGRKRSDINASIVAHQIRQNKKDAKKILKDTDSKIDPELSHMNKNYFHDPNRLKDMRGKLDTISKKRQETGGKKVYKSANVFMVGTLQISDDSLEALGWEFKDGKKLPADKQSDRAIKNVELVYKNMINSVKLQPEIYGDIFSATLHMDEGSPHVDFMSDPLDIEKPDRLARYFLNGPKGTPRGHNLSVMQDNIMKHSKLRESDIEKYGLVRGDGTSERLNTSRELRAKDKLLTEKEELFEGKVKKVKSDMDKTKIALSAEKDRLKKYEKGLSKREEELSNKELKASETLEKALDIQKVAESLKETYEGISDKIRRGIIRPEDVIKAENKAKEELKPFEDDNPEHLQTLEDALKDLDDNSLKL